MSDGLTTVLLGDAMLGPVQQLLARFGVTLRLVADGMPIEASYWGEPEAGLVGSQVHARLDTPVHSVLHEAARRILRCNPFGPHGVDLVPEPRKKRSR